MLSFFGKHGKNKMWLWNTIALETANSKGKISNFKEKMFSTNKKILFQGIAMRNTKTLALTAEDLLESIRITSPSSVAR